MIGYLTFNDSLIRAFQSRPVSRVRRATLAQPSEFSLAPKLADYFADGDVIAIKGELDRPIAGLAIDSRRVAPGQVFFAL